MRIGKRIFAKCLALGVNPDIAFIMARRGLPVGRKRVAPSLQIDSRPKKNTSPDLCDKYLDEILESLRKRPLEILKDADRSPLFRKFVDRGDLSKEGSPFEDQKVELLKSDLNGPTYAIAFNTYGKRFLIDFEFRSIRVIPGHGLTGRIPTSNEIFIVKSRVSMELKDPDARRMYDKLLEELELS